MFTWFDDEPRFHLNDGMKDSDDLAFSYGLPGVDPNEDEADPGRLVLDNTRIPVQEITPRCGCGGELEMSAQIREGVLVWDINDGVRVDLNEPDFFSGILGPVTIACKECGQQVELDLRVHPFTTGVGIEDSEGDVFYPG